MPNKMMENKTKSKIPKTAADKGKWIKARQEVSKQSGKSSEKAMPWGLVTHIYQAEKKAGKTIKTSDVKKTKKSPAVSRYKGNS